MQLDILQDMKESIEKAIENGETLEQFKKNLLPILYQKGWTGKQLIEDPITKEIKEVYIDTPSRLKTIYETNLRSAYMTRLCAFGEEDLTEPTIAHFTHI